MLITFFAGSIFTLNEFSPINWAIRLLAPQVSLKISLYPVLKR
ncbi:hypothetical protein vBEcoMWL3_gp211 [Escherichia phage vB_EcoM_WL-3]|nr:hypothetical protein vBEcoMWL3_gp211 [Escherichia phage vB_EcoM_WL-3]